MSLITDPTRVEHDMAADALTLTLAEDIERTRENFEYAADMKIVAIHKVSVAAVNAVFDELASLRAELATLTARLARVTALVNKWEDDALNLYNNDYFYAAQVLRDVVVKMRALAAPVDAGGRESEK